MADETTTVLEKTPEQLQAERDAAAAAEQAKADQDEKDAAERQRLEDQAAAAKAEQDAKDEAERKRIADEAVARLAAAKATAAKPFVSRTAPTWGAPRSTAKDRLRAFEDKHLGKDAARIGGQVERGHGSAFKALSPELHAEYAAIEKLIVAEQKVDDAKVSLETAKADLAIAQSAVVKA